MEELARDLPPPRVALLLSIGLKIEGCKVADGSNNGVALTSVGVNVAVTVGVATGDEVGTVVGSIGVSIGD